MGNIDYCSGPFHAGLGPHQEQFYRLPAHDCALQGAVGQKRPQVLPGCWGNSNRPWDFSDPWGHLVMVLFVLCEGVKGWAR